jgi:hypothetical protein
MLVEVNICVFGASGNLSKVKNSLSQGICIETPAFLPTKCALEKKGISFRVFLIRETVSKDTCRCLKVKTQENA